jgi:UPF0716 protein FxsA
MALFLAVLIVGAIVELTVIVQVATWIGVLDTIGLLLLVSILGAWLVKRQGMGLARRVQAELQAGRVPGASLVDGLLLLIAGLLLVVPGFVSDAFGLLLLLPPVRALVRAWLRRRWQGGRGPSGGGQGQWIERRYE